ncbi:MAG: ABC transporter permease subunit [Clostridiales bacterium]|nr:ABC transporter permease subunit [Clostridiales bacterium]
MNGVKRKKRFAGDFLKSWQLTALALPAVTFMIIFNYVPYFGFILPFKNYRYDLGFFKSPWVGFKNFEYLFSGQDVLKATRNTVLYNVIFIIMGLIFAIAFAIMLFQLGRRAVKTYQTIFFIPYFISWVVASFALSGFLDVEYGIINNILGKLGMEPVLWYSDPKYWPVILVVAKIWKDMGYNVIIFYTELMSIDTTYYEAADLDGANGLQKLKYITLPCLKRIVVLLLIMNIGKMFSGDFGMFYNLPLNSSLLYSTTDVLDTYVYRALINLGDIGMSSAATMYQSVVGFVLVVISNGIVKKLDDENAVF